MARMHKHASFAWKQVHNPLIKTSVIHFLQPESYSCAKLSLCVFITRVLAERSMEHKGRWYEIQGLLIHWPLSSKCRKGSRGCPFNKRGIQAYKRRKRNICESPASKHISSTPRHKNNSPVLQCTTQHVIKVLRAPAHTQRPNFTPSWRVFLTLSQLTRNICHQKDWISRAPAERKYGIMACLPKHHYNRALHFSWLISKPVTSPHCWFPLWREKRVILFTKASASPRFSPRTLKCLIHRLREIRMRYFNRISIVGLIALKAVEIPASTAPENNQTGEFARWRRIKISVKSSRLI